MAKPKKIEEKPKVESVVKPSESKTLAAIRKKFGDNTVITADKIVQKILRVISVSPVIDDALGGGGIQDGKIWVMSGPPRIGKTTTAFHYAGNAQKAGKKIVYISCESRLENRNVLAVNGLKLKEVEVVQHCKGHILTAEHWLSIVEDYIHNEENCVIIVDSISILCESIEMTDALGKQKMTGSSKLVAQFIRRNSPVVPVMDHVLILIAQQYQNPNPMAKKYIAKFGSSVDYALSYYMQFTHAEPWKDGKDTKETTAKEIGQYTHFNVERSVTSTPRNKFISYQLFGHGIDELSENLILAEPLGIIIKDSSWYSSSLIDDFPSVQGEDNLRKFFIDNPKSYEQLKQTIKEFSS